MTLRDRGSDARLLDLEEAAEAVLEAPNAIQLLDSAAGLVAMTVPSCRSAAVALSRDGGLKAIAASDSQALGLERLQAEVGEGPSFEAAKTGEVVRVEDLSRETRWPTFGPRAAAAGIQSVLALATAPEHRAVLSLYADELGAFGPEARARAEPFVAHIRLVLAAFEVHEQDAEIIEQLRAGLESRTVIGQAQGILMERERITAEAAFAVLRTASQHTNVKLREIAARVVDTGEDPRAFAPGT